MLIKKPRQWKIKLLLALFIALIMELSFFSFALADTVLGSYSVSSDCEMTINRPFDFDSTMQPQTAVQSFRRGNLSSYIELTDKRGYSTKNYNAFFAPSGSFYVLGTTSFSVVLDPGYLINIFGDIVGEYFFIEQYYNPTMSTYYDLWYPLNYVGGGQCDLVNEVEYITPIFGGSYYTRLLNANTTMQGTSTKPSFEIDYFLEDSEWSNDNDAPNTLLVNVSDQYTTQVEQRQSFLYPLNNGTSTKVIDFLNSFSDGDYTASISFWNWQTQRIVFSRSSLTLNFTVSGGVIVSQDIVAFDNGIFPANPNELNDCSWTNPLSCIIAGFSYLFYPQEQSISQFSGTWDTIRTKPPFGYITSIIDEITNLDNTGTPAWTMPSLPFVSSVFDPIKNALSLILWGIFGIYFYQRVTRIEI